MRLARRSAFTVLELSVALAVIALLTLLSIPAYKRILASGAVSQSTSNLRAIAAMAHGYAAENNGVLPPMQTGEEEIATWDSLLLAYSIGTSERIFAAKADRFPRPPGKTPRSYSLNPRFAGKPVVAVSRPSVVALVVERHASANGDPLAYVSGPPFKPTGYSDFPYEGKTQIALFDGCVAMVEKMDWLAWHRTYIDPENPDWQ